MKNSTAADKKQILEQGIELAQTLYHNEVKEQTKKLNETLFNFAIPERFSETSFVRNLTTNYVEIGLCSQWNRSFEIYNHQDFSAKKFQFRPEVSFSSGKGTATISEELTAGEYLSLLAFVVNDVENYGIFSETLKTSMERLHELKNNVMDLQDALFEILKQEQETAKTSFMEKLKVGIQLKSESNTLITIEKITDKYISFQDTLSIQFTGKNGKYTKADFYNNFKNYQFIN